MFNNSLKKDAIAIHESEAKKYNLAYENMIEYCEKLLEKRKDVIKIINSIESLINSISNKPKEFNAKMGDIQKERDTFKETQEYINKAHIESIKSGVGVVAGAAGGMAFAGLAPSVAMSIATTFGTASTGTAISALSGAVAQKAALAWLGGGALAAGGGGVAAGQALLALAGPIGWSISAVSTGVSLFALSKKNKKIASEAIEETKNIAKSRNVVKESSAKIENLYEETNILLKKLDEEYTSLAKYANSDYVQLDDDTQINLGALVNNTLTISRLVNKTLEHGES